MALVRDLKMKSSILGVSSSVERVAIVLSNCTSSFSYHTLPVSCHQCPAVELLKKEVIVMLSRDT